jgi:thiol-disulfide isomerase/thioredoxin
VTRFGFAVLLSLWLCSAQAAAQPSGLVKEVRAALARNDFVAAEQMVAADRDARGHTPENLEAYSWLGRAVLAAEQWERADEYAQRTYDLAVAELTRRPMDREPRLPVALGAAIEVMAQAAAARGQRSEAVAFLRTELARYGDTSLHARIQKNINLLSLEGSPAPALDLSESVGERPPALEALKGQVGVMFFWAHWCADCKAQLPVLERLVNRYRSQGLVLVAPTRRYGYIAGGATAPPAEETRYIAELRRTTYASLGSAPTPLAEANHRRYGVSTTPTLVVVDRDGLVRLYRPGQMTEAQLEAVLQPLLVKS